MESCVHSSWNIKRFFLWKKLSFLSFKSSRRKGNNGNTISLELIQKEIHIPSNKMMSWILLFISIVVIIQPLTFPNISACNQQHSTLTIHIKSHTFNILFLLPISAKRKWEKKKRNFSTCNQTQLMKLNWDIELTVNDY